MTNLSIAVAASTKEKQEEAENLVKKLDLPLVDIESTDFSFLMVLTPSHLELREISQHAPGPLFIDFLKGPLAHRLKRSAHQRQLIARAVGIKGGVKPYVFDATAGLGRDAMLLASLGCRVDMAEKSPIIAALLEDALNRAKHSLDFSNLSISLTVADATSLMHGTLQPDVVYLDPMYADHTQSALAKKEMRYLQKIVGKDDSAEALLMAGLVCAKKRVVVKRALLAPAINGAKADFEIKGKTTRFDVYLSHLNNS